MEATYKLDIGGSSGTENVIKVLSVRSYIEVLFQTVYV